jgi:hypothetical protein
MPPSAGADFSTIDLSTFQFPFDSDNGTLADIPKSIRDLNGQAVAAEGMMIPLDAAEAISQFALVPKWGPDPDSAPPVQTVLGCKMSPGTALRYFPDRIRVIGIMHVAVVRDGDYIVSLYSLNVQRAQSAARCLPLPTTRPDPGTHT